MTEEIIDPVSPFASFGLSPLIVKALDQMNYKDASPVQAQAIPLILENKDIIVLSKTGSGKTAACAIPICNRVNVDSTLIQALIIVPTRELALQYATEVQKIGKFKGVKVFAIYGGEDAGMQLSKIKHGVQVLVATPGRLIDFIYTRQIDLSHVETLILDEADEMLSMGFAEDLDFIIGCLVHPHQTLLFSATMPKSIRQIAQQYMKSPHEVTINANPDAPSAIEHYFIYCHHRERDKELLKLIQEMQPKQGIIFCHSRIQVEQVTQTLKNSVEAVDFLHAGLGQDTRTSITNKFRTGKIRLLVATDVVARGLDFSNVSHVFLYQIPADPDAYIHRAGRTGRYNKKGVTVSLVTQRELSLLKPIAQRLKQELQWLGTPPVVIPVKKVPYKGPKGT